MISTIILVAAKILLFNVRESGSLTDSDSESKNDNSSDSRSQAEGKDQKHKDHSKKNGNFLIQSTFISCAFIQM